MNQIKSLFAFLFILVATLFTASDAQAFAFGNHAGGFFLGTLDCAGVDDSGTRNPCRENGWLNYDTLSGYCVATKRVSPSGVPFSSNPNKTTTILGRWDPDMKPIIGDVTGNLKSWDFGGNPGGFNVLNVPDGAMRLGDFWGTFNKPFLNAAIKRGDDIALATLHTSKSQVIGKGGALKGMYAHELKHLVDRNYKPSNINSKQWSEIQGWFK